MATPTASEARFNFGGTPISNDTACPNIFAFCAFMSAVVAKKRGGLNSAYLRECADFMADVLGKRLYMGDQLPADYDWTVEGARDSALAMLEYDDG